MKVIKGKDDFFKTKRKFLVTIREIEREGDNIKFKKGFKKEVKAYRASDAMQIIKRFLMRRNKNRKPGELEIIVTSIELHPDEKNKP